MKIGFHQVSDPVHVNKVLEVDGLHDVLKGDDVVMVLKGDEKQTQKENSAQILLFTSPPKFILWNGGEVWPREECGLPHLLGQMR